MDVAGGTTADAPAHGLQPAGFEMVFEPVEGAGAAPVRRQGFSRLCERKDRMACKKIQRLHLHLAQLRVNFLPLSYTKHQLG